MALPARASLACLGAACNPALWMPLALEPLRAADAPPAAMCTAANSLIALLSGELGRGCMSTLPVSLMLLAASRAVMVKHEQMVGMMW